VFNWQVQTIILHALINGKSQLMVMLKETEVQGLEHGARHWSACKFSASQRSQAEKVYVAHMTPLTASRELKGPELFAAMRNRDVGDCVHV
jgi:hypothetical protein